MISTVIRKRSNSSTGVTQESVRNVIRHADATTLNVSVVALDHALVGRVADNGNGIQTGTVTRVGEQLHGPDGHLGLRLLSDLTADVGARFSVDSKPGDGTTIEVEVPL